MQFFSDLSLFLVSELEVLAEMVRDNSCALVFSVLPGYSTNMQLWLLKEAYSCQSLRCWSLVVRLPNISCQQDQIYVEFH